MSDESSKAPFIGTFDKVAIFASLGVPLQYYCVKYYVEYVTMDGKRDVDDKYSDVCRHISTVALKEFISKALQKKGKKGEALSTLVFFLDTIAVELGLEITTGSGYSRKKLFESILTKLVLEAKKTEQSDISSNLVQELKLLNIPEGCEGNESKQECLSAVNERYVAFVPGVITRALPDTLTTFRFNEAYPIVVGTITVYALDKLLRISSANDDSLAIVVDTTHGVNYFVLALKDGIQLAAELYAYASLLRSKPRRIVVYHYNSDPVQDPEQSGYVLSAKLHLLNEIPVTMPVDGKQGFMVVSRYVPLLIEQAFSSAQNIKALVNRLVSRSGNLLKCPQSNVDDVWRGVVYSVLLFSRNLLLWALRQAHDISLCSISTEGSSGENDSIDRVKALVSHIISVVEEMKIVQRMKRREDIGITEYEIDYDIEKTSDNVEKVEKKEKRVPDVLAVVFPILGVVLKSYAEYASKDVKHVCESVAADAQSGCVKDSKALSSVLSFIQSLSKTCVCFDVDKVLSIARGLYPPQDIVILEHEIDNLREIIENLRKRKDIDNPIVTSKHITIAKLCNNTYVAIPYDEGKEDKADERNTYAHAGLARGLPWFAVVEPDKNKTVICLGDPRKVINIVLASAKPLRQE